MDTATSTYLSVYRSNITSRIKELDLFLKTNASPFTQTQISKLLHISKEELKSIMREQNISRLTTKNLMLIMKNSSDEFCRMFQRELEYGLTDYYSPEQVSYIYNIDIDVVIDAFSKMGVSRLHSGLLETLFDCISINSFS